MLYRSFRGSSRAASLTILAVWAAVPVGAQNAQESPTPASQPAGAASTQPLEARHGQGVLHNVLEVRPGLLSGSMPEGDAGFDELARRGIRTIISVDGATPDLDRAKSRGMRYVHLPVGYRGIDAERQRELARAIRDLPSPIYLHCHPGKHRGPAAAASAAVLLGSLTPEQGVDLLKRAGTSPQYPGLFACVADARRADKGAIDAALATFPPVAPLPDFVRAMAAMQDAFDHLAEIRDSGWAAPAEHPDLVPLAEAARLADLARGMTSDPYGRDKPAEFTAHLKACAERTAALEAALQEKSDRAALSRLHKEVGASCRDCHALFRDRGSAN